jgi:endonuclease/exonuclease/phosphatase (EEP) superfamily protein YafD
MISVARSFMAVAAPVALLGLHFAVMMCYINRWDQFVPITLVPIWAWASLAIVLSLLSLLVFKGRLSILSLLIWLGTGLICADETPPLMREVKASYLRSLSPDKNDKGFKPSETGHLRVITLNCSDRNLEAALELKSLEPDIVFLQQCPTLPELRQLAQHLFGAEGSYVSSWQCAIVARGKLDQVSTDPTSSSIYATLETVDDKNFDLINLHLQPSIPRFDIWKPDCWGALVDARKENRTQLRSIAAMFPERAVPRPRIIGGDFGTPPGDAIFRVLDPNFDDSFKTAGRGWPDTWPKRFPVLRIDQLWASGELEPVSGLVLPSNHSDHRIVVCDYQIAKPEGVFTKTGNSSEPAGGQQAVAMVVAK